MKIIFVALQGHVWQHALPAEAEQTGRDQLPAGGEEDPRLRTRPGRLRQADPAERT